MKSLEEHIEGKYLHIPIDQATVAKDGDVFRWSYNEDMLLRKSDGNNGGTTYWCVSRIVIYQDGKFTDTFWYGSNNNRWAESEAAEQLELQFLGNLNDFEKADESVQCMYSDKDCMNLNHSNSTRGNFYIRKGAKKDLAKMERVLKRNIKYIENSIQSELQAMERFKKDLLELSDDSYVHTYDSDISRSDWSYMDEEEL